MRRVALAVAVWMAACGSAAAGAAPGLANVVYWPYVRNGLTEVELRGGRLVGGDARGDSGTILELEHGFSDRLSLALVGEFEDEPGDARKLDSIGLEAVTYLGQVPGLGVDVGGYLEYEQRIHNESGVLEGKLLLAKRLGPVRTAFNLIAKQALTDRKGEGATDFGYAAEATTAAARNLSVGLQAFGDLGTNRNFGGRHEHFLGPVARWEIHPGRAGELEFEAAYLFPLGQARRETDGQVKFALEWERRF